MREVVIACAILTMFYAMLTALAFFLLGALIPGFLCLGIEAISIIVFFIAAKKEKVKENG